MKTVFLVFLLLITNAFAMNTCDKAFYFNVKVKNTLSLLGNDVPGEFIYQNNVRVKGNLVFESYRRGHKHGESFGEIYFMNPTNSNTVYISDYFGHSSVRNISRLLLAKVLDDFYFATRITTDLNSNSIKSLKTLLQNRPDKWKAIKELSVYKDRASLGFTKINKAQSVIDLDNDSVVLVMERDF
jgi:hypothetical protein